MLWPTRGLEESGDDDVRSVAELDNSDDEERKYPLTTSLIRGRRLDDSDTDAQHRLHEWLGGSRVRKMPCSAPCGTAIQQHRRGGALAKLFSAYYYDNKQVTTDEQSPGGIMGWCIREHVLWTWRC